MFQVVHTKRTMNIQLIRKNTSSTPALCTSERYKYLHSE